MHRDHEHQSQDSRQSLSEQIHQQFLRQSEMERQLEREDADRQGKLTER